MPGIGRTRIERNPVKYNLHHGLPSVGTFLALSSPTVAEQLATVGWEWLAIDIEHSQIGFETVTNIFRATQLAGSVPMARIPWNETIWIQRTLDAGALGLIVPMINNVADAESAVANMKYATLGQRSYGGTRIRDYVPGDYPAWANDNVTVIVMIETVEAARNAEQILAVPGVDGCFIGPTDLAMSMGVRPDQVGPGTEHEALMLDVLAAGKKVGTAVGKHCLGADEVNQRIEQGFQFLALMNDSRFMMVEATNQYKRVKLPKS